MTKPNKPAQESLGIFVIPAGLAATLRPEIDEIATRTDDTIVDALDAMYATCRTVALHRYETDAPDALACWNPLADKLADKLGRTFDPPLIAPEQVQAVHDGLEGLEAAALARDLRKRHRKLAASAIETLYGALLDAIGRANEKNAAVFAGRWYGISAKAHDKDEGEGEVGQPSAAQVARFERWLDEQQEQAEGSPDWYGLFVVPAGELAPFDEIFANGANADLRARTAREAEAFRLANEVAVEKHTSNEPEALTAFYDYIDWLRAKEQAFRGLGVYHPSEVKQLGSRLADLDDASTALARPHAELRRIVAKANAKRAGLVITRRIWDQSSP